MTGLPPAVRVCFLSAMCLASLWCMAQVEILGSGLHGVDGELDAVFGMPDVVVVDPVFRAERWTSTQQSYYETVCSGRRRHCVGWAVRTCDRLEIAPGEHRLALLSWF